jgi:hypothetical protein
MTAKIFLPVHREMCQQGIRFYMSFVLLAAGTDAFFFGIICLEQ